MRKHFYSLFAAASMMLAVTSCSQEEDFAQSSNGMTSFQISLNDAVGSRVSTIGDGSHADNLYCEVYLNNKSVYRDTITNFTSGSNLDIPLLNGETYSIIFWAQDADCSIYNLDDLSTIKVKYEDVSANQESYDAFYNALNEFKADGNTHRVELRRPFAQLNLGTSDWNDVIVEAGGTPVNQTQVTIKGLADEFYPLTGEAKASTTELTKTFTYQNLPEGTFKINETDYRYLSLNYILVPGTKEPQGTNTYTPEAKDDKATVDLTFDLKRVEDKKLKSISVPNAPVQRNWRTNIIGSLLTGTNFDIVVDSNPDGEHIEEIIDVNNTTELQAAINEATDNTPIRLRITNHIGAPDAKSLSRAGETTKDYFEIPAGKDIVLDLNGFTICHSKENTASYSMIVNKGKLTIVDSSSSGSGKIMFTETSQGDSNYGWGSYTISNEGELVLESGEISVDAQNVTGVFKHALYAIQNTGSLTVNGGKIANEHNQAVRMYNGEKATELEMNGGEISGTRAIWIQLPGNDTSVAPECNVKIAGGTLNAQTVTDNDYEYKLAIYSYSSGNSMKNVNIEISGGTINGDVALTGGRSGAKVDVEKLTITGGTFNGDVYSYADDALAAEAVTITGGEFTTLEPMVYMNSESEKLTLANNMTFENVSYTFTGKGTLDLNQKTLAVTNNVTGKNYNFIDVCKNGNLTVKNGTMTLKHEGANMNWNNSTNVFNVTAGGVLNIEDATVENLGGSDMAFCVHLNNWGEVTLKAKNTTFKSTYVGIRAFNSGNDKNNITLDGCNILTGGSCIWVHNYTAADFGNDEDKTAAAAARLNFNFTNTTIERTNGSESLIRFGFTNSIYYSDIEMTNVIAGTAAALTWAAANGKDIKLLNDIELSEVLEIGKSLTFNGNEKKLITSANRAIRLTASDITVEISNLNIVSTATMTYPQDVRGISLDGSLKNIGLTLNNCIIDFTDSSTCDWTYAVNISGTDGTGYTLNVEGGTYEGANVINVYGGSKHTINVDGAILNSNYKPNASYCGVCVKLDTNTSENVATIKNTTFNSTNNNAMAIEDDGKNNTVTEKGNTDNTKKTEE